MSLRGGGPRRRGAPFNDRLGELRRRGWGRGRGRVIVGSDLLAVVFLQVRGTGLPIQLLLILDSDGHQDVAHGQSAMRVVGGVRDLRIRELRLPIARADLAFVEGLVGVELYHLGERDDVAVVCLGERGVDEMGEGAEFDEAGGEKAKVTEELLSVI